MNSKLRRQLQQVNQELWVVLSIFLLALFLNHFLASQRMLLGLYTLPSVFSAYVYGRRHAVATAVASVGLVALLGYLYPTMIRPASQQVPGQQWFDFTVWGCILIITAYAMGTLYEHKRNYVNELRETYNGVLVILRQFISKDKYTQNHSYRVSLYATRIAAGMGLDQERIEDVRAAALLHDIGKLDISRELLYKAARLTPDEFSEVQTHVQRGVEMLSPVGGTLRRVLPIILAHHDKFDGSGYHPTKGDDIPMEARIIAVADVYDALTSDRPYRQAISPFEAREIIEKGSGKEFDPHVVEVFLQAFRKRELEIPELVL